MTPFTPSGSHVTGGLYMARITAMNVAQMALSSDRGRGQNLLVEVRDEGTSGSRAVMASRGPLHMLLEVWRRRMVCLSPPIARCRQAVCRGPLIRLPDAATGARRLSAAAQAARGALGDPCCVRLSARWLFLWGVVWCRLPVGPALRARRTLSGVLSSRRDGLPAEWGGWLMRFQVCRSPSRSRQTNRCRAV
jgi:hypothetical protein